MKRTNQFPDLSQRTASAFSESENGSLEVGVMLDGMKVIFDKKVSATPVNLDYKKNRKVVGTRG